MSEKQVTESASNHVERRLTTPKIQSTRLLGDKFKTGCVVSIAVQYYFRCIQQITENSTWSTIFLDNGCPRKVNFWNEEELFDFNIHSYLAFRRSCWPSPFPCSQIKWESSFEQLVHRQLSVYFITLSAGSGEQIIQNRISYTCFFFVGLAL